MSEDHSLLLLKPVVLANDRPYERRCDDDFFSQASPKDEMI